MTSVERTFTVDAAPNHVIEYLKDFGNAPEWDPGTQSCDRIDEGPIAVGSSWHNVSKILGKSTDLTYTLDSLTDDTIVLVGKNDTATSTDTITVRAAGAGSEITYHVDLDMHGIAKLAAPVMKIEFERLGVKTEAQMTERLNKLV
ncbi:MAG: SRPBCC family protein [Jatrophihabitans sp.]